MPVRLPVALAFALLLALTAVRTGTAAPIGNDAFQRTWMTTDKPVADLRVSRTWMWGPSANTGPLQEPYADSPSGQRTVQYFDKSRMEITHPDGDPSSIWYVTNGLLAKELITGRMQLGDNQFQQYPPAQVNVAGDADDPNGPTYATFNGLMAYQPIPTGWTITQTVDRSGQVGADAGLAGYGVTAALRVPETNHTVASVFWDFMNATGLIYQGGQYVQGKLFDNPFYATGYPLTEPYWTSVKVGGVEKRVLAQIFERRVLTYTPDNPEGWKVESGNVGQHYYTWRYVQLNIQPTPTPTPSPSPSPSPAPSPSPSPAPGPATSFGSGTFRVGVDIAPGTYRNSDSSNLCYWERLSGFGGTLDDIIANNATLIRQIVTISPSDAGFSSNDCGIWTPDDSPLTASPTASFGDGVYRVGRDIAPGLWQNSDSSQSCYWERLSGFGGTFDEIIANGFSDQIQIVRISNTDTGFSAQDCGSWTRIGN